MRASCSPIAMAEAERSPPGMLGAASLKGVRGNEVCFMQPVVTLPLFLPTEPTNQPTGLCKVIPYEIEPIIR